VSGEKYLIVNADDFGQSPGINRGIIEAHEHGIVTSASLMTRWLAAGEAAAYAREHPKLSVGLHLDLGEWVCREGKWAQLYSVISLDDRVAVEREVSQQFDVFQELMGRPPTHANSHQHIHMREPVRSVTLQICQSLGIPLRDLSHEIHYYTKFYGQTPEGLPIPTYISLDRLIEIISTLPTGLTVLTCHPGYADDVKTMYQTERRDELRVLCDPKAQATIDALGIKLCSFNDWNDLKNSLDRGPSADLV
jgi:chitin disaccharide deacetylase